MYITIEKFETDDGFYYYRWIFVGDSTTLKGEIVSDELVEALGLPTQLGE